MHPLKKSGPENSDQEHGRFAKHPAQIPKKGWKDIFKRVSNTLMQENTSVISAGVAFYAFTSIPAIFTAVLSVYGLGSDPGQVEAQMNSLKGVIPSDALSIITGQLKGVASHSGGALTLALVISVVFALYTSSSSMKSLMSSLNVMYQEEEKRGFLKYNAWALGLTFGAVILAVFAIAMVVGITAVIDKLPFGPIFKGFVEIIRWPILAVFVGFALSFLYRYGPSRENAKWKWINWGAVIATALWLGASALFSWYAGSFGNFNKTYGSLSAIVVLLMWFYITAFVVLLGAKINAEIEHQTDVDTTTGPPQPMGKRGATMADTRGEAA